MRVIAKPATRGSRLPWVMGVGVVALSVALVGWWCLREPGHDTSNVVASFGTDRDAMATATDDRSAATHPARRIASPQQAQNMSSNDPDDLASYFQPGDPEPTGAQVIEALQQAGVRTGLGAFNPPGTSPPLVGLAVPEGYELPRGYVRHHQVTDEGVPIEPILMFSPDFTLHDAQGRPIAMPADRVVPPELAPPGMPRRQIQIPPR